jgi:hypothetical protein
MMKRLISVIITGDMNLALEKVGLSFSGEHESGPL